MSRNRHRLPDYLTHVLDAIERIDRYAGRTSEAAFLENEMVQDAVIRNLEIIGEACRNIMEHYSEFAASTPQLPLSSAYQMRNALAHGYFKVDLDIVWKTIRDALPALREQMRHAMAILSRDDPGTER